MQILGSGALSKMRSELAEPIEYKLALGDEIISVNQLLEKKINIKFLGAINCLHCGRKTKKSFSQGFCYPCFTRLPQCDTCIMSPEKCHFQEGTCRDPAWGESHCFVPHIVYLANSSGVKVGITRGTQTPTRWIDQGAVQALPIFRVQTRFQSGLVERVYGEHVSDRTNWRAMLKGQVELLDLESKRDELLEKCAEKITDLQNIHGLQAIQPIVDATQLNIQYPVIQYPVKVVTHNLDKIPEAEGVLLGVKGQYLILDTGVINMRKYTSYQIELSSE
ncbi:DUF2797 domain-containing protein [Neptunomonas antarctica]|uniref:DUF2797 domain-containing protein n=1 Tax=Neptunomonas antarctica TaxID=619304 RepID=A0A1N7KCJ5_9GAMM|nr:DUF2797 domain-containing protein [Neptunomonas antarctica]SIS59273.1 Protein of unknown function [Neptunomonas antarctica]